MAQANEPKYLVDSPENAHHAEKVSMSDPSDATAAMAVTVHQVGEDCVCNLWFMRHGQWFRLQNERVIENDIPHLFHLAGELYRYSAEHQETLNKQPLYNIAWMELVEKLEEITKQLK
jgi:hypothetical protein